MDSAPHPPQPSPVSQPVMDVVPPRPAELLKMPPEEAPALDPQTAAKPDKKAVGKQSATPKATKPRAGGTGIAIVATVIIILGLASLMVYAYLRTNGF